jgi:hypothetical protein
VFVGVGGGGGGVFVGGVTGVLVGGVTGVFVGGTTTVEVGSAGKVLVASPARTTLTVTMAGSLVTLPVLIALAMSVWAPGALGVQRSIAAYEGCGDGASSTPLSAPSTHNSMRTTPL